MLLCRTMHQNYIVEPVLIWLPLQYFQRTYFSLQMSFEEKVEIFCQTHKVEREYSREAAAKWFAERKRGKINTDWEGCHQFSHAAVCSELLGVGVGGERRGEARQIGTGQTIWRILYAMQMVSDFALCIVNHCGILSRGVPWLAVNSRKLIMLGGWRKDETRGRRPKKLC